MNPAAADAATLTPEDQERRQNFWWYLLMAGIVLLGLETAISNRMKGPVEGTRITPTLRSRQSSGVSRQSSRSSAASRSADELEVSIVS